MHVITERVPVNKDFYVAFDGAQFDSAEECAKYEAERTNIQTRVANLIPHVIMGRGYIESSACDCDQILVFYPMSLSELYIINAWAELYDLNFDVLNTQIGVPIMFDIEEYFPGSAYGNNDLRGVHDIYSFLGTQADLKKSYCISIDLMPDADEYIAAMRHLIKATLGEEPYWWSEEGLWERRMRM